TALDEGVRAFIESAFELHDVVFFDGISGLETMSAQAEAYNRPLFFEVVEKVLLQSAHTRGKRLICSRDSEGGNLPTLTSQAVRLTVPGFTAEDYRDICAYWIGEENGARIDHERVYRYSEKLNGHQLRTTCMMLKHQEPTSPSDAQFFEILNTYVLLSNVDTAEVEDVSGNQLKGVDHLVAALEKHILGPIEDPELAQEFGLKPKRGVLLHGPPGTGKTSIGRLLAHRMKGKFFMIDGTVNAEEVVPFYTRVHNIFTDAIENSPSVIFIDDADVLFKTERIYGFNRYMLSQLDGLESESRSSVCVMMTAMDVNDLP